MSRTALLTTILLGICFGLTGTALAGNGAWPVRLLAERQAAQTNDDNQASIEQNRGRQNFDRSADDDVYVRSWGRARRNFLRAGRGESHNEAMTAQHGSGNVAGVGQIGQNLTANITQAGNGNIAYIRQWGRGSTATITQIGSDNTACVIQIGRDVSTDLAQTGGQSTGLLQTPRGSREVPVEFCTNVGSARGPWRGLGRR